MPESLILWAALAATVTGLGWLALAMDVHWAQVFGDARPQPAAAPLALRVGGTLALVSSLVLCLKADHVSMAVLVWTMALAAAALALAFTLAWRPRWLAVLVPWRPGRR